MDFILEFTKFLQDRFPQQPKIWHQLVAYTLFATVLPDGCFYKVEKKGKIRPNIWAVIVGPSGRAEKSIVFDEVVTPILLDVQERTEKKFFLPSLASSIEGMIDRARGDDGLRGLIIRDEFTTLLKEAGSKGYTSSVLETYSKMYDGRIPVRATRQIQMNKPLDVYVNLLGATTPDYLFKEMKIDLFAQGTGNRISLVYHKPPPKTDWTQKEIFGDGGQLTNEDLEWAVQPSRYGEPLSPDLQTFADELVKVVTTMESYTYGKIITATGFAEKESTAYKNKMSKKQEAIPDGSLMAFKADYIERNWHKSLKFAMLRLYSRNYHLSDMALLLDVEDVKEGQRIVDECEKHFDAMVEDWFAFTKPEEKKVYQDLGVTMNILRVIKQHKLISNAKLALESGNTTSSTTYASALRYLSVGVKSIAFIADDESRKLIRTKSKEWLDEMRVDPNPRGQAPTFYKYLRELPFSRTVKAEMK